ncbi:MAG: hypothetical protein HYR83_06075 [Planctomycetes bacterium]|nr:hypothetical protein [Planctomycetota bacterium]
MSGTVSDRKRLIRVTAGNLRNDHLYITGHLDFFPPDAVGPSKKARNGQSKPLEIWLEGLNVAIETDLTSDAKNGKPRRMFRGRKWVRKFYEHHQIKTGDVPVRESVTSHELS